jgi:hypothetical protein
MWAVVEATLGRLRERVRVESCSGEFVLVGRVTRVVLQHIRGDANKAVELMRDPVFVAMLRGRLGLG